jgi:Domain of unknown function (DUF4190)/Domain of unknown function (DUF1707)
VTRDVTRYEQNTRVIRGGPPPGRPAWAPNYLPPGPIPPPAGPPGPPVRATDRDRDATIDVLQESYATGRLTADEHAARVSQAMSARTYLDLNRLTADLHRRPFYPDAPRPVLPRRTNGYAVAALVCGAAQPLTFMLTTIPAVIFGHVARRQIRETGEDGRGMATWGLALGWAGVAAIVLVAVLLLVAVVVFTRSASGVPTTG